MSCQHIDYTDRQLLPASRHNFYGTAAEASFYFMSRLLTDLQNILEARQLCSGILQSSEILEALVPRLGSYVPTEKTFLFQHENSSICPLHIILRTESSVFTLTEDKGQQ